MGLYQCGSVQTPNWAGEKASCDLVSMVTAELLQFDSVTEDLNKIQIDITTMIIVPD